MATKIKNNKVTLKAMYIALKELEKMDLTKKLPSSSTFLEVHLLLGKKQGKNLPRF